MAPVMMPSPALVRIRLPAHIPVGDTVCRAGRGEERKGRENREDRELLMVKKESGSG